jgi:hypothetical protein
MAGVPKPSFVKASVRRYLRYNSLRKGLLGQNKFWLSMFALGKLGGLMGKASKRGVAPVVFTEALKAGQSYEIAHITGPPTRRQRRKATRVAKKFS